MFLAGRGLQSAELNEIQDYVVARISGIGDAIFADGDVVSGATCVVNPDTGDVVVESGKIYLRGAVRQVGAANFIIPTDNSVVIGIWYDEATITELDDLELRDPAVGMRNCAARLKSVLSWDFKVSWAHKEEKGEFYPVYIVENGVLIQNAPSPQLDAVQTAIARYDKESNGSYVVNGLGVTYLKTENGEQTFVIAEEKAHVDGYELELSHSLRIKLPENPDIRTIESEPYTFQPSDEDNSMLLTLNHWPIKKIMKVDATIEKTMTMTHGLYTECSDAIPDTAVLAIVRISQGSTLFLSATDYRLHSGEIDWLPARFRTGSGQFLYVNIQSTRQTDPNRSN